jgi:type VI protein secretion system component VasF
MQRLDANSRSRKVFAAALICSSFFLAQAQQAPVTRPTPGSPVQAPGSSDENDNDPMAHHAAVQQAERRNTQRQQDIVNDTAKLLELAQQLKAEVDKSRKDQLSVSVVKKAEEIEKLAKSVKEKMKGS